VRLADDRRGRIPFALVGVLLLVSSAAFTATILTRTARQPPVDRAMDDAATGTQTAVRGAVAAAGREAAAEPVVTPAATPYGRALSADEPFRDALRARIYVAVRDRLGRVDERAVGVSAGASLPPIRNASEFERAIERIDVERAGPNGSALRVRIEGIRLAAWRDGRRVGERRVATTVTVAVPALALHDRAERFERRLNAAPTERGLGRRLTVRLHAMAWPRGYAQYRGAPISNVLANRHVETATNGGALAVQRTALGATDPAGERAHAWAAARVGTTDLLAGAGLPAGWAGRVLRAAESERRRDAHRLSPPERGDNVTVAADRAAATAFAAMVGDDRSELGRETGVATLADVAERTYAVDARRLARTRVVAVDRTGRRSPGEGWRLVGREVETERSVESGDGVDIPVPAGWRTLERHDRAVVERRRTVRRWRRDNRSRTTRRTVTRRYAVTVAVAGRHSPGSQAPRRGIAPVYRRGGPLDGPNLADAPRVAAARLVGDRGGADALARRAVAGHLDDETIRIAGDRPDALRRWLRADLAALHRRVQNVSVERRRTAVGTYAANPPAALADRLRERRAALIDAPAEYGGVADKARIAARTAYLVRAIAVLERRAAARNRTRSRLDDRLRDAEVGSLSELRGRLELAGERPRADAPPRGGIGGPLEVSVDTAPRYLTLGSVDRERLAVRGGGSVRPLAARNRNVFAVPYGDGADALSRFLFGPQRVPLRGAAQTLQASRAAAARNETAAERRSRLRGAIVDASGHVRSRLRGALARSDVGETAADRRGIVASGLSRWETPAARAAALANGSAAPAIARAARPASPARRVRLTATLREATATALEADAGRVPRPAVAGTGTATREFARHLLAESASDGASAEMERTLGAVPAGLPVAPVPGYWYATLNVWHVEASGAYERLTVRARGTDYTRDGSAVRLDVDGDGARERLGRSTRVAFAVETGVVVVVPPGGRGVGDVGGTADEHSPGYG